MDAIAGLQADERNAHLVVVPIHVLIWFGSKGNNQQDLADRYGINIVSLYDILKQQRKLFERRIQGRLLKQ